MDPDLFEEGTLPDEAYQAGLSLGSYCASSLAHPLYRQFALGFSAGVNSGKRVRLIAVMVGIFLMLLIGVGMVVLWWRIH